MPAPSTYASYLVRLWREADPEQRTLTADWQGEVEHIQTSRRWTFSTLDELLNLLLRQVEDLDAPGWSAAE